MLLRPVWMYCVRTVLKLVHKIAGGFALTAASEHCISISQKQSGFLQNYQRIVKREVNCFGISPLSECLAQSDLCGSPSLEETNNVVLIQAEKQIRADKSRCWLAACMDSARPADQANDLTSRARRCLLKIIKNLFNKEKSLIKNFISIFKAAVFPLELLWMHRRKMTVSTRDQW